MFNTGIYPKHALHVKNYMYNTGIYSTYMLHV